MKKEKLRHIIIFIIIQFIIVFVTPGYSQTNNQNSEKKTYVIGYMRNLFNGVDINDAQAAVKVWVNEIIKTIKYGNNYNIKTKIYNNFNEVYLDIKDNELAALSLNSQDYFNNVNKLGLEPVIVPSVDGEVGYEYYLLVRKEEGIKSLKQLKDKSIGLLTESDNSAAIMWLDVILAKDNFPVFEKFFKLIYPGQNESQLILNLFFGKTDACIVTNHSYKIMSELNPQIRERLTILSTSPDYLLSMMCFLKSFNNKKDRQLVYSNAFKVPNSPAGKQILTLLKIDKILPYKDGYLTSYKNLLQDYNRLIKTKKK